MKRTQIIDVPWAIVYGPRSKLGVGLAYGLGRTRREAWENAALVYNGYSEGFVLTEETIAKLKKLGMVARRVEIHMEPFR